MKVKRKFLIVAITAAGIAVCGCKSRKIQEGNAPAERIRIAVSVDTASRRTLVQERKLLGVLEPYRETDLSPQSPGRVKSIPVMIGDPVTKGQVVAVMDDAQYVALNAQFQSLKAQYDRSAMLLSGNAIPKAQFESIEAQYTATKRQLENLAENTVIRAPFPGIITARAVEEGELYTPAMAGMPGQPKGLVHLTQLDPLKIDLAIDDQTVEHLRKGMKVRFTVEQIRDSAKLSGTVEYVNPQANAVSRTFDVRVVVPNTGKQLRPGYFAEVHLALAEKKDALCVPRSAVVGDRIFVVHGKRAFSRKVGIGWINDTFSEIVSGIDEGELVVIKGNKALPDSAEVELLQ